MTCEVLSGTPEARRVHELWRMWIGQPDFVYCDMDDAQFEEKFFGADCVTLLHESGDAFASGTHSGDNDYAFVTAVVTAPRRQRQGLAGEALAALEDVMRARFHVKEMRILFFNPAALTWEVPGHPGCQHPNAPGVDTASLAHGFFLRRGYQPYVRQNSYFLPLADYAPPAGIREREEKLRGEGIEIAVYDAAGMTNLREMLAEIGNPVWMEEIPREKPVGQGGRPILVPVKDGRVLGFAGPIDREKNGRGYFSGIAVAPEAQGKGIAKVLFAALCKGLKGCGADYMTLFTGETNPARRIYEAAGFGIVRSWDDMKKELK